MIVYCDTSFLFSYLNEDDVNHKLARGIVSNWDAHDFVICEAHLLELPAAVRAATHRSEGANPARAARD
jgi:predicted nucleic acid-binding protein